MIATFPLQAIAEASAVRMVDCLLGGTLIGFLAAAVLRLSPRQRSGLRFAVWFSALLAIAALPFLTAAIHSQHAALPAATPMRSVLALPGVWAIYIFVAWFLIAGVGLTRLGISLWQMRELRRSCVALAPENIPPQLRATLAGERAGRRVALCTSDRVQVPTAIGLQAPAVVIPQWLMSES